MSCHKMQYLSISVCNTHPATVQNTQTHFLFKHLTANEHPGVHASWNRLHSNRCFDQPLIPNSRARNQHLVCYYLQEKCKQPASFNTNHPLFTSSGASAFPLSFPLLAWIVSVYPLTPNQSPKKFAKPRTACLPLGQSFAKLYENSSCDFV